MTNEEIKLKLAELPVNYAKLHWHYQEHHRRFVRFIHLLRYSLICQECRGAGGWTEPVLDDGTGPWEMCSWCEGTGFVSSWLRGQWLRFRKEMKQ